MVDNSWETTTALPLKRSGTVFALRLPTAYILLMPLSLSRSRPAQRFFLRPHHGGLPAAI